MITATRHPKRGSRHSAPLCDDSDPHLTDCMSDTPMADYIRQGFVNRITQLETEKAELQRRLDEAMAREAKRQAGRMK